MNELVDLQPKIVEKMIEDNIVMIDVRRVDEFKRTGVIKNAKLLTFRKISILNFKQNHNVIL